jgi:RND family efflux transporter MFP subunit
MKRHILALAALCLLSGCHGDSHRAHTATPTVAVARAETDSAVTVFREFPGYLAAMREVDLVTRIDGTLTAKSYQPGSRVEQGTLLFSIEPDVYVNALGQARANLADARATLDYNRRNYAAMQQALEADAVSQMEVLQAHSDVLTSEAAVKSAEAAVRTAEITLSHCSIRAPFAGRVSDCPYSAGAYFSGSDDPVTLARIFDDSQMKALFSITADEYAQLLSHGSVADLTQIPLLFDEDFATTYTADFSYFAPSVDRSTGTVAVTARVDNPDGELRSGMFVRVELPVQVLRRAVTVQAEAVGRDQRGTFLYTVDPNNCVEYTPVTVAATVGDSLSVISEGIRPGTLYVTRALLKVRPGMIINPQISHP